MHERGRVRRDHHRRHSREPRARRADHQGSAQLPGGIIAHPQAARTACRCATPLAGGNASGPAKPVPRRSWVEDTRRARLTYATPENPHPRFRLPGHPADRPARARSPCVLRSPPLRRQRRLGARLCQRRRAQGRDPLGQPRQRLRGHHRQGAPGRVRTRRAGAGHLLWHADHGAAARRQGRRRPHARIRLRRSARARPHGAARRTLPTSPRPRATACSRSG